MSYIDNSAFAGGRYELWPLGSLVEERSETGDAADLAPLSVGKQGVTAQLDGVAKSANTSSRKVVRAGDIAINSRSDRRGAAGLAKEDGTVSVVYSVMKPNPALLDKEYAHHLLRSIPFQEEFFRFGTGIHWDLWSTRFTRMRQIPVPLPSLPTQRAIADYLDRETAEIAEMAGELDQLVERLEERKRREPLTVFEEIDTFTTLNVVSEIMLGKMLDDKKNTGTPRPYLRAANVTKGRNIDLSDLKLMRMSDGELGKYSIIAGDIIMIEGGDAGRVAHVAEDINGVGFQKTVMRIRPDESVVDSRYLFLALDWAYQSGRIALEHSVSTIPHFTAEKAARLPIPVPAIDEQRNIVGHLDQVTAEIDSMIADARELKALFVERRSALITEVVTGRKEVQVS